MTQKPLILAVETSGRTGSVAIATGERILAETGFSAPMRHSAEVFTAAHGLLKGLGQKPEGIEHIYVSVGPGSFTGLRIAVTMAKTMYLANAVRVVAVDTLDVIAANAVNPAAESTSQGSDHEPRITKHERLATILDAKRGRFFVAVYQKQNGQWTKTLPDCLMTASEFIHRFAASEEPVWLLGEGLVHYADKFKAEGVRLLDESYWWPQARKVHFLGWKKALVGQFADPLTLTPAYMRKPDVKIKQ